MSRTEIDLLLKIKKNQFFKIKRCRLDFPIFQPCTIFRQYAEQLLSKRFVSLRFCCAYNRNGFNPVGLHSIIMFVDDPNGNGFPKAFNLVQGLIFTSRSEFFSLWVLILFIWWYNLIHAYRFKKQDDSWVRESKLIVYLILIIHPGTFLQARHGEVWNNFKKKRLSILIPAS